MAEGERPGGGGDTTGMTPGQSWHGIYRHGGTWRVMLIALYPLFCCPLPVVVWVRDAVAGFSGERRLRYVSLVEEPLLSHLWDRWRERTSALHTWAQRTSAENMREDDPTHAVRGWAGRRRGREG